MAKILKNSWSTEEDSILYTYAFGKKTLDEISELLPNRTRKAVQGRMAVLKLRSTDGSKDGITKSDKYATKTSLAHSYKSKYNIALDVDKGVYTYQPEQWWIWSYYGTPNGRILKCIPKKLINNEDSILKIIRYVLNVELKLTTREQILKVNYDLLKKI